MSALVWPTTRSVHDILRPLGHRIGTRAPETLPHTFLKVYRIGGETRDEVADDAVYVVEVYAPTDEDAERIAFQARDLLNAAVYGDNPVRRVTWASGVASLDDPDYPKHRRTTQTVIVTLRASTTIATPTNP